MNWLIYIDGFFPFWLIFTKIINFFDAYNLIENKALNASIVVLILYVSCPLLIWVWICFKFIN